jgi:hypothetical protein
MEDRLDGLLQGFLRLLVASRQHEEYLRSASPDVIKREIAQLEKVNPSDPAKVQEINKRRVEILQKRLEKFGKISENFQVINAQCSALTDVLALIRDQSVTMKDPQQVSNQLDGLVRDVEQTEETVRQMESIFDMSGGETNFTLGPPQAGSTSADAPPRRPVRS